jgi:hypothetical protein
VVSKTGTVGPEGVQTSVQIWKKGSSEVIQDAHPQSVSSIFFLKLHRWENLFTQI